MNSTMWWSASTPGYLENKALSSGASISPSIDIKPSLRTLERTSNSSDIISMYSSLVWREPLNRLGSAPRVALMALPLLPTKKAPTAPPKIMTSSSGCHRAARCPPCMTKEPKIQPQTITYPRMTNKCRTAKALTRAGAGVLILQLRCQEWQGRVGHCLRAHPNIVLGNYNNWSFLMEQAKTPPFLLWCGLKVPSVKKGACPVAFHGQIRRFCANDKFIAQQQAARPHLRLRLLPQSLHGGR